MRLGRDNRDANATGLDDIVDSMPYSSAWAPGQLAGCDLGDAGAGLQVNPGGVSASGGFSWTTVALIVGGFWLFKKYVK